MGTNTRVPGQLTLLVLLAATMVSTALHYTDNYVRVDDYPQPSVIPTQVTQIAILVAWPLLTAVGLIGYRLYVRRRFFAARICLAIYALTGIVTLGHFFSGMPMVAWYWFITLFTDAIFGFALWGFAIWSMRWDREPHPAAAGAAGKQRARL